MDSNYRNNLQNSLKFVVDEIIPRTQNLAYDLGYIQYYGALDEYTDEYLLVTLNHMNPILVSNLIDEYGNLKLSGSFVSETMMGYYSEWSGYGSTRLAEPDQRKLEFVPISWVQVGYPGPSLGYRVLREYSFE